MTKPGIALQLYTVRSLAPDLSALLAAVAEAGYRAVETAGDFGHDLARWQALLAEHGLEVIAGHVGLEALRNDLEGVIAWHTALGNRTLVVPWLAERPEHAEGWQALGAELDALGRRCRERGVTLLYHNHAFEMAEVAGRLVLDWLVADREAVGLQLDLAWVVRGGQDPLDVLGRYQGRCPLVHVKDLAPAGRNLDEGGWADVGDGVMPWAQLLPAAIAAGARWFIVEHDDPQDPLRTIRRSREALAGYLVQYGGGALD